MIDKPDVAESVFSKRHIAALLAGNALEFYDFLIFSFFAIPIGRTFFPSHADGASLLATLATFGAGFLTRPIGGIVIGLYANRAGRKPAMVLSFVLMGVAMLGMACTPSFETIGVSAQVLVVFWRLLQGFALGGEVGPTTAALIEGAPPHRRGLFGSLQIGTQQLAVMTVGIVGFSLSRSLGADAMAAWGWRAALMAGLVAVPLGLLIRGTLPETLHARSMIDPSPTRGRMTRIIILVFLIMASNTVGTYVLNTLTTYAINTLKMDADTGFAASLVRGACGAAAAVIGGLLTDRFGRRWPMIITTVLSGVFALPLLILVVKTHQPAALLLTSGVLGTLVAGAGAPALTVAVEALPRRLRAGAIAISYAFAISVFGGSTPFLVTWLTGSTHDPLVPGWCLIVASIVGLAAVWFLPETAPGRKTN